MSKIPLTQDEVYRYSRHFPVIGLKGQEILKNARVLCIGAGGLGSPVLQYLAAAGIGFISVVDGDSVDESNLQRQILFSEADVGINKAIAAVSRLKQSNSKLQYQAYPFFLARGKGEDLFKGSDVVIDATDDHRVRHLINELCRRHAIPMVSAGVFKYDAQISVYNYQGGPCYQCMFPTPPEGNLKPSCAVSGIIGAATGVLGAIQASEVIKILLNTGNILSGTCLFFNLLTFEMTKIAVTKNECDKHPTPNFEPSQKPMVTIPDISAKELETLIKEEPSLFILDVREQYERDICALKSFGIPLGKLDNFMCILDKTVKTVVFCKTGSRSLEACQKLKAEGFSQVINLAGGIKSWIKDVDSTLMSY